MVIKKIQCCGTHKSDQSVPRPAGNTRRSLDHSNLGEPAPWQSDLNPYSCQYLTGDGGLIGWLVAILLRPIWVAVPDREHGQPGFSERERSEFRAGNE